MLAAAAADNNRWAAEWCSDVSVCEHGVCIVKHDMQAQGALAKKVTPEGKEGVCMCVCVTGADHLHIC